MATKFLQFFPKPLLDDLVNGRWLPVVGAGMSLNAAIPVGKRMPLWGDLSKLLSDELSDYSSTSVLDAISAYEHEYGRARLIERLSDLLLLHQAQPGEAHKEFCSIPFDIVCTTNFDFLLERQYDAVPRYVYPVVDEDQLSINTAAAGTLLLKLHGDVRHPSRLIVTEADYDGFLARFPLIATYLSNQLITKTAVFIGYSLDDPDFRQIWQVVSDRLGRTRRMAYAISVNARASDIARFERRGVKVVNLPGTREKYGAVLAETFKELREYLRDNVIAVSKVTEEQPLRELQLPRDAMSRLCFFSLPLELLPLYRERIFPIVQEIGFVPVTADDVIAPGDNVNAKIDSLIDRSTVMIVELTSQWTRAEYEIALAKLKGAETGQWSSRLFHLIIVATAEDRIPSTARDFPVLYRKNLITEDTQEFASQLAEHLRAIAEKLGVGQAAEPQRLFDAKEYRAAVISAMTLLETRLKSLLSNASLEENSRVAFRATTWMSGGRRPLPMRALLDQAMSQELIDLTMHDEIRAWMNLRNEAVHNGKPVSKSAANEVVTGVTSLLRKWASL